MNTTTTRSIAAQIDGIDAFLFAIYDREMSFLGLIQYLGVPVEEIDPLYQYRIGDIATDFVRLIELRLCAARQDGLHMYSVVCRRFGLDGRAPSTLESLGNTLGISRERVSQIETKTLRSCRSRTAKTFFEQGLRQRIAPYIPTTREDTLLLEGGPTDAHSHLTAAETSDIEFIAGIATSGFKTMAATLWA